MRTQIKKKNNKKDHNKTKKKNKTKKMKKIDPKIYNPPPKIIPIKITPQNGNEKRKITINVIRDDLLEAGSKQRAMVPYLENHPATEFLYVAPNTGSAQITLAYSALLTKKKITLYLAYQRPLHPLTKKALKYGTVKLVEFRNSNMKVMNKEAKKYIEKVKASKGEDYIFHLTLGFDNTDYKNLMIENIRKAIPKKLLDNPPKRIWVPTGSTLLLNALYKVFPKTYFNAVQIGRTVWDDQIEPERTTVYRSQEFFYNIAKVLPPFPTTKSYDAKVWKFVLEYGEDGDYLWNVTQDFDL